MYGKYTLFYESPKNWGYLRPCANSVYQASPQWGGGGGGLGTRLSLQTELLAVEDLQNLN